MSAIAELEKQKQSITFQQILIATDFSEASERALSYAVAIACRYSATLSVLHAIPPGSRERRRLEAEQQMKHLGETVQLHALNHHLVVEQGRVSEVLETAMQREKVDLLVLGTHGRGGLKKLALGSVAEEVLRLTSHPVLTVGPHVPPLGSGNAELKRILFATDFGPTAAKAFPYALSLAEGYQAKLVLLHMISPMPATDVASPYGPSSCAAGEFVRWQHTVREESQNKLRALIPEHAKLASEPEFKTGMDFIPEGILDMANGADLIVMGASRTSAPRRAAHMPWSLIHEVVCQARCPVLTVSN